MTSRLVILLLLVGPVCALSVNSPRPATVALAEGHISITWTNLSTLHPWIVSYRDDATSPWRWETARVHADPSGALHVIRPVTEPMRLFRLWPAAP